MKIRHRVLASYVGIKVILCIMVGFLAFGIVGNSFDEYGKDKHLQATESAEDIFTHVLQSLRDGMKSWLVWDDSYYFIENGNKAYINSNIAADNALKNVGLNMMTYWKKNGQYVYGVFSKDGVKTNLLPPNMLQLLVSKQSKLKPANPDQSVHALINTPYGPMYIGSMPIYLSSMSKPTNGRMIFGRLIDKDLVRQIDHLTTIKLKIIPVSEYSKKYQRYLLTFKNKLESLVYVEPNNSTTDFHHDQFKHYLYNYTKSASHAYSDAVYWDVNGNPLLIMEASEPTTIANVAIEKTKIFYFVFLLVSLLSIFATFTMMDKFLIQPVQYLSKRVSEICMGNFRTLEIPENIYQGEQNDEIYQLRNNMSQLINDLFDNEEALIKARVQAEQASQAKSEFLANMSHEIRTPLNSLMGALDLISMGHLSAEERRLLEIANISGKNLMEILGDILDFSKIESGRIELNQTPFDFNEMIAEIETIVRPPIEKKGLSFKVNLNSNLDSDIWADKLRMKQVIINLLTNAKKYSEKGTISLNVEAHQDTVGQAHLYIEILDTGVGISSKKLETIFERFSQIDNTSTKAYQGVGLGLSICKKLVDFMGGKIGVDSEEGNGSKFWLEFLVDTKPKTAQAQNEVENIIEAIYIADDGSAYCPLYNKMNILVVDDQPMNRTIMLKYFQKMNYDCDMAIDGPDAIEKFKQNNYDLIFMDIQMPEMDGVEAASIIRDKASRQPIIIALTANTASGDIQSYLESGMDDYIGKPVSFIQLKNIIKKWSAISVQRNLSKTHNG